MKLRREAARGLAESIDYARQGESAAQRLHLTIPNKVAAMPATRPVEGVTEEGKSPGGAPQ